MYFPSFSHSNWYNYSWMWVNCDYSKLPNLPTTTHHLEPWIQPFWPHPGGFANSKMKQISSTFSLSLCFSADSISLLKAIQQCPGHWSGRGSVQCGGKWLSQGMIDLNSTMAPPKATQAPLRVMDARMSPITFSSVGKTLFHYQCRPHLFPSLGGGRAAE